MSSDESDTCNPVIAEVTRGGIVESRHRGAYCIADSDGGIIAASGDIETPVFPRSSIKAMQALAMVEAGVADRFGFTEAEIALSCASHAGEEEHIATARAMLAKIGLDESAYECGPHWPDHEASAFALARAGAAPGRVHNNCSGKHAGMLGLARVLDAPAEGYTRLDHPVQQAVAQVIGDVCHVNMAAAPCGIDGCSVPNWALPLRNLAYGFSRFGTGQGFSEARAEAARRIIAAVRSAPFMVAGTGRFCTNVMQAVPQVFVKTGAEGMFCGTVPETGIGIALKCDDGAKRGAECLMAQLLTRYSGLGAEETAKLETFTRVALFNRAGLEIGEVRAI
jgi:L-asparaginase II